MMCGCRNKFEDAVNVMGRIVMLVAGVWFLAFVVALIYYVGIDSTAYGYDSLWWMGWIPVGLFGYGMSIFDNRMPRDFLSWIRHG